MTYREDIPGYMTRADFKALEALAACVPQMGIVVEIGSFYGRSSWAWAKSVHPTVTIYCVDPWTGTKEEHSSVPKEQKAASLEEFREYVQDCPNIIPIQGYSPTMSWDNQCQPDLVFIDGNHFSPYVDNDLTFWSSQLISNGILCGHDFNPWKFPDVCEAAIHCAQSMQKELRIFDKSTIWYMEMAPEKFDDSSIEQRLHRLALEEMSWHPSDRHLDLIRNLYPQKI